MLNKPHDARREKRKRLVHITAGMVILFHAYEKYTSGHGYLPFLLAGLIFLSIAFLHPVIEKRAPWIDGVFFILEATLSVIIAIDYFHLGKKALPFVYVFLAFFQVLMAFIMSRKGVRKHKEKATSIEA